MRTSSTRGNGHDRSEARNHAGDGRGRWVLGVAICLAVVALGSVRVDEAKSTATVDSSWKAEMLSDYGKLPIRFTQNQGQYPEDVKYYFDSPGGRTFFTSDGVVMQFVEPLTDPALSRREDELGMERRPVPRVGEVDGEEATARGYVIRKQFVDANPHCRVEGSSALPGTVNIFRGSDPSQWKTGIPTYRELTYHDLYPGIDLVYKGVDGRLKYDLIVNPGADASRVRSLYEGVDRVEVTESGALAMSVTPDEGNASRPIHEERAPVIYQEIDGERVFIDGSYHVQEDGSIGFQLSGYDPAFPVVIDPATDLIYSTFLGGAGSDSGSSIAIDEWGNVYVAGTTRSSDFPTSSGAFDTTSNGGSDGFVTKLNPELSGLVYSAYLGGATDDSCIGIAVDGEGNAYVTGGTHSSNFPTTSGAYDTTYSGGQEDAYVTKLNVDGSGLLYSTFLGGVAGVGIQFGVGIAVDGEGNAYVIGGTGSSDFPTTWGAFDTTYNGGGDAFVTKLNAAGSALLYSTFLGGGNIENGSAIALDDEGNAYVTGDTESTDFPTTPGAFDTTHNGLSDGFVTKLDASGSALIYSTFLGGGDPTWGGTIAVDASGNAYVTGTTYATDFPTTPGAFDTTHNGDTDCFVTKLDADGSALVYSTFLGGGSHDNGSGRSTAIDEEGNAYLTGWTESSGFPTTAGAFDTSPNTVFVTKLDADGSALQYSTFLGGGSLDSAGAIAVDRDGNGYVTGYTHSTDFPTTPGAYGTTYNGGFSDVFVCKMQFSPPSAVERDRWREYE